MTIKTYRDVTFPFDTEISDGHAKVRLLAAVCNEYNTHIIGYIYYGDDPATSCSQVLEWDENGIFGGGQYPSMDLVPPPSAVEGRLAAINAELAELQKRLDDNPDAPEAWRSADERKIRGLKENLANLAAPHIWGWAA